MAGIYLHIPFCRQACVYCDFHFSTKLANKQAVVEAMLSELDSRKNYLHGQAVKSLYFGGGTPSVLQPAEISAFVEKVAGQHDLSKTAEITLEANPDDLTAAYLRKLAQTPVNRLSIGVQSFRDRDLRFMNRSHNAAQAHESVENARDFGFQNITLDLIYGLPEMNDVQWQEQLQKIKHLTIPHFSAYALTVEPKTVLSHQIKTGKLAPLDEDRAARQFAILQDFAESKGFEHYELSNFARPNWYAVHNSSYWHGEPYLGIGPAAHSFNGEERHWNVANNTLYLSALSDGKLAIKGEKLSDKDRYNEMVMTQLRLAEGLDLDRLEHNFGGAFAAYALREAKTLIHAGKLAHQDKRLFIPKQWRFHSDGIAAELFYI